MKEDTCKTTFGNGPCADFAPLNLLPAEIQLAATPPTPLEGVRVQRRTAFLLASEAREAQLLVGRAQLEAFGQRPGEDVARQLRL